MTFETDFYETRSTVPFVLMTDMDAAVGLFGMINVLRGYCTTGDPHD